MILQTCVDIFNEKYNLLSVGEGRIGILENLKHLHRLCIDPSNHQILFIDPHVVSSFFPRLPYQSATFL